jgi:hypothetical protein
VDAMMPTLPLCKYLDPFDLALLKPELVTVDRFFTSASPQHPMRRWEYAMALRAASYAPHGTGVLYDVGGAGSPLSLMLLAQLGGPSSIIDPAYEPWPRSLEALVVSNPRMADLVTCISVLEHIPDLDRFCYHLACLVAPGGLLFLTVDICDQPGAAATDHYDLHWMRERMFNPHSYNNLLVSFLRRDFTVLGGTPDLDWHGAHVSDYSFASLALVKRA